jgi:hypothetical protein
MAAILEVALTDKFKDMHWEDKREMTEQVKREYQEYLDYMYEYEEENGNYPMHLSNGQWTPYSTTEYLDKTKNGTERLNF